MASDRYGLRGQPAVARPGPTAGCGSGEVAAPIIRKQGMTRSQVQDRSPDHHGRMHARFGWEVPTYFNIAQACCVRWSAAPDTAQRVAIVADGPQQRACAWTYAQLQEASNRLANALAQLGVQRGDRVAIVMPQRFETAVAYLAVLQMGAVAMPLSMLFGPDALEFRLHDSEAVVAICDAQALPVLESVRSRCPLLHTVIRVGGPSAEGLDYAALLQQQEAQFTLCNTGADEAAVLIYTSGTTGQPKGALIPHRALIGNLSGFVCSQNWFGFDPAAADAPSEAVFWSPADWAWTGGLMDALLPTLYFGRPIVAWNGRFSPQAAFELMQAHGVTHTFLFPTALKAMMKAYPEPRREFRLALQAVMSAGEAVGAAVFEYCQRQLGVVVNEMFGQTEINYVVGNCSMQWSGAAGADVVVRQRQVGWPARAGSMGRTTGRLSRHDHARTACPTRAYR